jgi:hypothetical protein
MLIHAYEVSNFGPIRSRSAWWKILKHSNHLRRTSRLGRHSIGARCSRIACNTPFFHVKSSSLLAWSCDLIDCAAYNWIESRPTWEVVSAENEEALMAVLAVCKCQASHIALMFTRSERHRSPLTFTSSPHLHFQLTLNRYDHPSSLLKCYLSSGPVSTDLYPEPPPPKRHPCYLLDVRS